MNYPTLEQLRAASATGNKNYLAEQEADLSRCLKSWRAGIVAALRSVVKNNTRTYRVIVSPGGSYSAQTVRMAHNILEGEIRKEIPGIDVQHESSAALFVITWERTDIIFG